MKGVILKALCLSYLICSCHLLQAQLFQPILLNADTTVINLQDFVLDEKDIIDVSLLDDSDFHWDKNRNEIKIGSSDVSNGIVLLNIKTIKKKFVVPLYKSSKQNFLYEFNDVDKKYKTVSLAGSFNGWSDQATPLKYNNGVWQTTLLLDPGSYQYQLVRDGGWDVDPNNENQTPNGFGAFNSVLTIENKSEGEVPKMKTENFTANQIRISIENGNNGVFYILWKNELIKTALTKNNSSFIIDIPEQANNFERSYIRVYGYNENGKSNDLLIPLSFGKVINESELLNRKDKHNQILYFMMIDRFNNGDTSNDEPVADDRVAKRANYQGGDLQGVLNKINDGYFTDLGVSTLWLSPITQNTIEAFQEYPEPKRWYSGYHGYWPINNKKVDYRFGDKQALKNLVDDAHNNNMNVILDFVSNHVHEQHPLIQNNPTWKTNLTLPDGSMNIRIWDDQRLTTWFDTFLPSLDFSKKEVEQTMVDTAFWWLKEFDLDGFRHDATKHIPLSYWRALTQKIKKEYELTDKSIYQVGETFGSRELIGSYVGSSLLDGQFDFNLYFDIRDVLAQDDLSMERIANSIEESLNYYGHHSLMANVTGNHDLPRFISYAGKGLSFEEDPKEAGWERQIMVEDKVGYKRLSMLHALILTLPGVPCIYYGDEFGMPGANDPDNRRMMYFDGLNKEEQSTLTTLKRLTKLRNENMALLYGETNIIKADQNLLVFKRSYFQDAVIIAINKSNEKTNFSIERNKFNVLMNSNYKKRKGKIDFELTPNSFEIIY